jgi:hypothetical protein
MSDRDRRIENEAYRIWDEAGRPEGKGDEHWYEAEKRIAAGEGEPVPTKGKKPKTVKVVAKSAGNAGVAAPVSVANDAPKPQPTTGEAVDVTPAKPKKAKSAEKEAPKAAPEKEKPAKATKPKSRG